MCVTASDDQSMLLGKALLHSESESESKRAREQENEKRGRGRQLQHCFTVGMPGVMLGMAAFRPYAQAGRQAGTAVGRRVRNGRTTIVTSNALVPRKADHSVVSPCVLDNSNLTPSFRPHSRYSGDRSA